MVRSIRFRGVGLILLLFAALRVPAAGEVSDPEAVRLLRQGESLLQSSGTVVDYRVEITRPDWQRTLFFRSQQDFARDRVRLEVLDPLKVRGTLFLKTGKSLSMYLPKLRREIAVSPAMMQDPWMGSDFNNQDLIESGSLVEDYVHRIVAQEDREGGTEFTIESVPKPDAPVTWGRLEQRLRGDGLPVSITYFDAGGRPVRRLSVLEYGEWGGRTMPSRLRMQPTDRGDQFTDIIVQSAEFNVALSEELFKPGR